MSASTSCRSRNAIAQLRAPDPPVWMSVSSMSKRTAGGMRSVSAIPPSWPGARDAPDVRTSVAPAPARSCAR
ncbi:hypothetical protein BC477_05910 [Clavibacter michiganensis subsp. michiganensis]|uniref:Uncharacterized protein n=1 Tax=Clavibacter michiganensis subsp. michiganensis TaxID=33013 RepID=A0A251XLH7_CLAMM|nr:hypothetical protein BC477_05910 [Clavibacter michiganensis subsp. michiganensis]OUE04250.1 hypothetical protein CMMCAS07_04840 [Clavibacter michiganensis subsp. michiganensis]